MEEPKTEAKDNAKDVAQLEKKSRGKAKKRHPVRFLFSLILLTALVMASGSWVLFFIPPDGYLILHSKTNGYEKEIIESGQWRWYWQAAIPFNVSLLVFSGSPQKYDLQAQNELPSGSFYAKELSLTANPFENSLKATISYAISKESLLDLVENQGLTPENLSSWTELNNSKMASQLLALALANPSLAGKNSGEWISLLSPTYPALSIKDLSITQFKQADKAMYASIQDQYKKILEGKEESLLASSKKVQTMKVESDFTLETLKKYGEMLQQYPILIQFFAATSAHDALKEILLGDFLKTSDASTESSH